MRRDSSESMVLDTGVLVEYLRGAKSAIALKRRVESGAIVPYIGEVNVAELGYLICRKEGWDAASKAISMLRGSGYFSILSDSTYLDRAARLKCDRAISFVDCITISMGEVLSMPVLFARHEREIDAELKKRLFKTKLEFLEDTASDKRDG